MLGNIYFVKNRLNSLLYIGSTTRDTNERFNEHRRDTLTYPNYKLYMAMKEFDINIFHILRIEHVEVNSIQELRKREGSYMKFIKPNLNTNIAGRTMNEYQIDNYESLKNYPRTYYRKYRKDNYNELKLYRQEFINPKLNKYNIL